METPLIMSNKIFSFLYFLSIKFINIIKFLNAKKISRVQNFQDNFITNKDIYRIKNNIENKVKVERNNIYINLPISSLK